MISSSNGLIRKAILLVAAASAIGLLSSKAGLNFHQALTVTIFCISILGTLLFWEFRLSFAFIGLSVLLITKAIDLDSAIKFASLEIILFLAGMMIVVGLLKESGFFAWIVELILRIKNLTARKFIIAITVTSALLACTVDEVTSIIFMVAAVLEICDYFEVDPVPYIMISIFATNIGSAATVLGNPIGILIASKSGLTFESFLAKAFPVSLICLIAFTIIVLFWYRKDIKELDNKIKELGANEILIRLITVPPDRQLKIALGIFGINLFFLCLHHRIELLLGVEQNTVLLITPLISAGLVMIWKREKARYYVEHNVEWWTLLFFMILFAQAGALKHVGVTDFLAKSFVNTVGHSGAILKSTMLWIATIASSGLDNVVAIAAMIPVVQSFHDIGLKIEPLWWALLFGGCFGGNITMIGSTANIVALGILEKERHIHMSFLRWFKVGLIVGVTTTIIAWIILLLM